MNKVIKAAKTAAPVVLSVALRPVKWAWTCFMKSQAEVEQDYNLNLFTTYKGHEVHLRPVMSTTRSGWVESWIPDQDECAAWDDALKKEEAAKNAAAQNKGSSSAPYVPPAPPTDCSQIAGI